MPISEEDRLVIHATPIRIDGRGRVLEAGQKGGHNIYGKLFVPK